MSTAFRGLRTATYRVSDLDRAKAWYTHVLGKAPYFDQPFYVGFDVGGFELGLDPAPPGSAADVGAVGGVTVYWGVDDVEASLVRLITLGAQPHAPVQDVGEGIRVAAVLDPFANVFGLIQNPHFKLQPE